MANRFKNNVIYIFLAVLFRVVNILPRRVTLTLGELLGSLAYGILKGERRSAHESLETAYGVTLPSTENKRIAKTCFKTFGRSALEVMRFKKYYRSQISHNIEYVGLDNFKNIYNRGNGIVAFTGHVGNFELLAAAVAQSGLKAAAIGRELYDKRIDSLLLANRTGMGIVNVRTDDSPRTIIRLLKEGHAIGFLIDTDSSRIGGEYIPFFGRLARTPVGPTQLGLLSGAAFVPVFCFSFPGGKYRIEFGEELVPRSHERTRENVYAITRQMTEIVEQTIRNNPDQWIWMHRRWRSRPSPDDMTFIRAQGITEE